MDTDQLADKLKDLAPGVRTEMFENAEVGAN
jgi:hypothetical protein